MGKLMDAVNKAKKSSTRSDDKVYYYPVRDAAGNGTATIRFLPPKDGEESPFVKLYSHGFEGANKKWFFEECPTTIGETCYCCEKNSENYSTMSKEDARKKGMNRKTSFIANIVVVQDKATPENEGKVFQYKFGKKIWDKIADAVSEREATANDDDDDDQEKRYNVFNVKDEDFDGLTWPDFKLKIRKVDKETNYDLSKFVDAKETIEDVDLTTLDSLDQYLAPSRFKSEEELKKQFDRVVGNTMRVKPIVKDEDEDEDEAPVTTSKTKKSKVVEEDDDDEVAKMMKRLADEDEDIPQ